MEKVVIEKLVHGGQAIGRLSDGRVVFVWNALPDEEVGIRITKNRKDYCEAVAEEIIKPSPLRVKPRDEAYLSTSPWQIMDIKSENKFKHEILKETLHREKVEFGDVDFFDSDDQWHYRNKMEYSFWADDDGLHLALHRRGSQGKVIVEGSSLARPEIDQVAQRIVVILNKHKIRGSQLKTLLLRVNSAGDTVAAIFVKDETFPNIDELGDVCQGVEVCFSNPKSPASILTKTLFNYGSVELSDNLSGKKLIYNVHSFFQVNTTIFEQALKKIKQNLAGQSFVDLYCGVGTIGVCVGGADYYIDNDFENTKFAQLNIENRESIILASSEEALDYISSDKSLVVDPPRAGLHAKVINKIKSAQPPIVVYLSCNPVTQARDIALLRQDYEVKSIEGYNFFPKTPHIESLAILIKY